MGYRSQVALKTTTEGWILMKQFNDTIEKEEDKPLAYMTVQRTPSGFYKISHDCIKWYEEFTGVQNFNIALDKMEKQDIPFVFIRIGEDIDDIEVRNNWTDDMPDELQGFEPQTEIYDENVGDYETVLVEEEAIDDKIKPIMYALFERYEAYDEIEEALRSLYRKGTISDREYDRALTQWGKWLDDWMISKSE